MARKIPTTTYGQTIAKDLINEILLSKKTVRGLISVRPYFTITVLNFEFRENKEFIDLVLRTLLETPRSVLYREIRDSMWSSGDFRYNIPESCRIIRRVLVDSQFASDNYVWKPIGEQVIKELNDLHRMEDDPYNWPVDDFEKHESAILTGIWFFDIMVKEALYQDIRWHMWMYYFTHFTDKIVSNMKVGSREVDLDSEWPTRYHFVIYTLFEVIGSWIESIDQVPAQNENIVLQHVNAEHENSNIVKSAIVLIGICLRKVLESEKLDQKFKSYIAIICFELYFSLYTKQGYEKYVECLAISIRQGGYRSQSSSSTYQNALTQAYTGFDKIPHISTDGRLKEFEMRVFGRNFSTV